MPRTLAKRVIFFEVAGIVHRPHLQVRSARKSHDTWPNPKL